MAVYPSQKGWASIGHSLFLCPKPPSKLELRIDPRAPLHASVLMQWQFTHRKKAGPQSAIRFFYAQSHQASLS